MQTRLRMHVAYLQHGHGHAGSVVAFISTTCGWIGNSSMYFVEKYVQRSGCLGFLGVGVARV